MPNDCRQRTEKGPGRWRQTCILALVVGDVSRTPDVAMMEMFDHE